MIFFLSLNAIAQPSDKYILSLMKGQHLPGLAILIIKDGKWAWYRNWGFANLSDSAHVKLNTVFMMASVSKTMTETALMQLWEKGKFKLDDDISKYLPFKVTNPYFPSTPITFRMVMAHVSSIKDNDTLSPLGYYEHDCPISLDTLMYDYFIPGRKYYSKPKNFYNYAPGSTYNYSNVGAALLGYLVQRISGTPFDKYCKTHIFDSLCMDNSSWFLSGISDTTLIARPYSWSAGYTDNGLYGYADYPCGQLRTTITDMAKYEYMYLNHGLYNGVRILDSATVDTMLAQQFSASTGTWGQGLIFYQSYMNNGDTMYGHGGGDFGVSTELQFNYNHKIGLLMFSNGDGFNAGVDTLWDTIYNYALSLAVLPADTFPTCNIAAGIRGIYTNTAFSVSAFPNPASARCYVDITGLTEKGILQVTDLLGQVILSMPLTPQTEKYDLNTSLWRQGVYILTVNGSMNRKLVIVR